MKDEEWKKKLSPDQYRVLREKGTEPPFTGKYLHNEAKGVYVCAGCGAELFADSAKFDSGSGWPSFYDALDRDKIEEIEDGSHRMRRIEIVCRNCKGHLGHVFPDGPRPTGLRYCVNSLSLDFREKK
ncbi:MAG TPA: peptide-methionine (R)-S-oxide reductase MsrB [Bacteroidota bacterium]|nr:peptide-methionine (R)-S-oxide reductase MsrB [Bacteroidota bacterium]